MRRFYTDAVANLVDELDTANAASADAAAEFIISCFDDFDSCYPLFAR